MEPSRRRAVRAVAFAAVLLLWACPTGSLARNDEQPGEGTAWQSDPSLQKRIVDDMRKTLKGLKMTTSCIARREEPEEEGGELHQDRHSEQHHHRPLQGFKRQPGAGALPLHHVLGDAHKAEAEVVAVIVLTGSGALEDLHHLSCERRRDGGGGGGGGGDRGGAAEEARGTGDKSSRYPFEVAFSFIFAAHSHGQEEDDPDRLEEMLEHLKPCTRSIQTTHHTTVLDEVPQPRVTTEYLEFITREYFALQRSVVFMELPRDSAHLTRGLEEAKSGRWHYLPLGPALRQPLDLEECLGAAPECDVTQLQAEVLSLYRRFTCEDGTCKKLEKSLQGERRDEPWGEPEPPVLLDAADPCMLPEVHSSFVVSAERIREVQRAEYAWLDLWLQSWQEAARGPRMLSDLGHRLWPLLLGCPELLHGDRHELLQIPGCLAGMQFMSGSTTEEGKGDPDPQLFHPGVVSLPRPADLHHHRPQELPWLRNDLGRKISFVVPFGEAPDNVAPGGLGAYLKGVVASVALWHPYASVVVLTRKELSKDLRATLRDPWFAKRMEVVDVVLPKMSLWMGLSDPSDITRPDALLREHSSASWAYAHWFQLVLGWLRGSPTWGRGAGELRHGHLVFVPPNTVVRGPLWPIFAGEPFALGFPRTATSGSVGCRRGSDGHLFPPGVMFVHRERIWQAELLLSGIEERLMERSGASFGDTVRRELLAGCKEGVEALAGISRAVVRCPPPPGLNASAPGYISAQLSGAIKLLEPEVWEGLPCTLDTQQVTPEGAPQLLLQQVLPITNNKADESIWDVFTAMSKAEGTPAGRSQSLTRMKERAAAAAQSEAAEAEKHQCPEINASAPSHR